jgi:hypothetical protein
LVTGISPEVVINFLVIWPKAPKGNQGWKGMVKWTWRPTSWKDDLCIILLEFMQKFLTWVTEARTVKDPYINPKIDTLLPYLTMFEGQLLSDYAE